MNKILSPTAGQVEEVVKRISKVTFESITNYGGVGAEPFAVGYSCFGLLNSWKARLTDEKKPTFMYIALPLRAKDKPDPYDITRASNDHDWISRSLSQGGNNTPEDRAEWFDFLLSDISPWRKLREFVYSVDGKMVSEHGGVVFNHLAQAPNRLLYSFCMATRFSYENVPVFAIWQELTKSGIDPRIAALIACFFSKTEGSVHEAVWSSHTGYHAFMTQYMWPYLGRFYAGEPKPGWNEPWGPTKYGFTPNQEQFAIEPATPTDPAINRWATTPKNKPRVFPRPTNVKLADLVAAIETELATQLSEIK